MLCLNLVYRNLRGKIMTGINSLILHPLLFKWHRLSFSFFPSRPQENPISSSTCNQGTREKLGENRKGNQIKQGLEEVHEVGKSDCEAWPIRKQFSLGRGDVNITTWRYISHAILLLILLAAKFGKPTQFSKINQNFDDNKRYARLTLLIICLFSSALAKVRSCVNEKSRNKGKKRPLYPRSQPRNRMRCLSGSPPRMRYFKATSRRYGTISSHLLRLANK